MEEETKEDLLAEKRNKEANTCLGLGVGVGALGAAGAAISGAVCPICFIAVPGLIGVGVAKKLRKKKDLQKIED